MQSTNTKWMMAIDNSLDDDVFIRGGEERTHPNLSQESPVKRKSGHSSGWFEAESEFHDIGPVCHYAIIPLWLTLVSCLSRIV